MYASANHPTSYDSNDQEPINEHKYTEERQYHVRDNYYYVQKKPISTTPPRSASNLSRSPSERNGSGFTRADYERFKALSLENRNAREQSFPSVYESREQKIPNGSRGQTGPTSSNYDHSKGQTEPTLSNYDNFRGQIVATSSNNDNSRGQTGPTSYNYHHSRGQTGPTPYNDDHSIGQTRPTTYNDDHYTRKPELVARNRDNINTYYSEEPKVPSHYVRKSDDFSHTRDNSEELYVVRSQNSPNYNKKVFTNYSNQPEAPTYRNQPEVFPNYRSKPEVSHNYRNTPEIYSNYRNRQVDSPIYINKPEGSPSHRNKSEINPGDRHYPEVYPRYENNPEALNRYGPKQEVSMRYLDSSEDSFRPKDMSEVSQGYRDKPNLSPHYRNQPGVFKRKDVVRPQDSDPSRQRYVEKDNYESHSSSELRQSNSQPLQKGTTQYYQEKPMSYKYAEPRIYSAKYGHVSNNNNVLPSAPREMAPQRRGHKNSDSQFGSSPHGDYFNPYREPSSNIRPEYDRFYEQYKKTEGNIVTNDSSIDGSRNVFQEKSFPIHQEASLHPIQVTQTGNGNHVDRDGTSNRVAQESFSNPYLPGDKARINVIDESNQEIITLAPAKKKRPVVPFPDYTLPRNRVPVILPPEEASDFVLFPPTYPKKV